MVPLTLSVSTTYNYTCLRSLPLKLIQWSLPVLIFSILQNVAFLFSESTCQHWRFKFYEFVEIHKYIDFATHKMSYLFISLSFNACHKQHKDKSSHQSSPLSNWTSCKNFITYKYKLYNTEEHLQAPNSEICILLQRQADIGKTRYRKWP